VERYFEPAWGKIFPHRRVAASGSTDAPLFMRFPWQASGGFRFCGGIEMKKTCFLLALAVFVIFSVSLTGCGKGRDLFSFSRQCGVGLTGGRVVSETDTHGGFHGDGHKLLIVQYPDSSIAGKLKASDQWHALPLSAPLQTFVYQSCDAVLSIPAIGQGCYYFRDRHAESRDPSDDTDLLNRHSFNFTFAIYDTETDRLYLCEFDT